jgi:hypothetical protein
MLSATSDHIRPAAPADADALELLARLDSQRPLSGEVLVAVKHGEIVAAIEVDGARVVADPFEPTANVSNVLRFRAAGIRAVRRRPTVRERIAAGLRPAVAA